jgi:hypothetical protein
LFCQISSPITFPRNPWPNFAQYLGDDQNNLDKKAKNMRTRLFGGLSFGMAASASMMQNPFVTVEQAPGTPADINMNFAVGNPDFFPDGARVHIPTSHYFLSTTYAKNSKRFLDSARNDKR